MLWYFYYAGIVCVGFFASEKSDLRDAFMTAANSMREDFKFAHTTAPEVLEEYKYSE